MGVESVVGDRGVGEMIVTESPWAVVADVTAPLASAVETGFGNGNPLTKILFSALVILLFLSI